jgi:hypothetical protein
MPLIQTAAYNWKNISMTIFLTSTLFFICQSVFPAELLVWSAVLFDSKTKNSSYFNGGLSLGMGEFISPLIYAVVFSFVVILRKPELKRQYLEFISKPLGCFGCKLYLEEDPYRSETSNL